MLKKNKERFQETACESYQYLSEDEKEKKENVVANDIQIFVKKKKENSIKKSMRRCKTKAS